MLITFDEYLRLKFRKNKENIKRGKEKRYLLFHKFCSNINDKYIYEKCLDKNNKIFCYSMNEKSIKDIIGIILYRKILDTREKLRYYIILMSIKEEMRDFGYGNLLLQEFCNYFVQKNKNKNKKIEFVLMSIPSSVKFYEKNGFTQKNNKFIEKNETIDNNISMIKTINTI